jgi:pantoate--beta-alanine ligase
MKGDKMKIVRSIPDLKGARRTFQGSVGFVPTMGFLHEGHLSLVRRAKAENGHTTVSIFVNPTQFLPHEDYRTYPRNEEKDLDLLRKESVDLVFLPEAKEMYGENHCTFVDLEGISQVLEGGFRPRHFRGVATVVTKLFNLMEPTRAYFGEKDAQQLLVIRKMVADLNMNLEVIACPTIREADGLAMSSRNIHLRPESRQAASVIARALFAIRDLWCAGERDCEILRAQARRIILAVPGAEIDYVSIADPKTLAELDQGTERALLSMAVKIGGVRLIDNVLLE